MTRKTRNAELTPNCQPVSLPHGPAGSCPDVPGLDRLLAGALSSADEAVIRRHLRACECCAQAMLEREPTWLFTALAAPAPGDREWAQVMAVVRAEVAANPRHAGWWSDATAAVQRWLFGPGGWSDLATAASRSAATVTAFAAIAVLVSFAWVGSRPMAGRQPASVPLAMSSSSADTLDGLANGESGFVYLSNPEAQVTQALVGGTRGRNGDDSVLLTMIVDTSVADAF